MTMTREEQIRKKAKELGQQYFPDSSNIWARSNVEACYVENACIEMAEWVDANPHWIPVEERLPEERKVVWVRKHFNKEVLGEFDIYDSAAFCNGEFQCDNSCNVTHWMEIVPPRKEE